MFRRRKKLEEQVAQLNRQVVSLSREENHERAFTLAKQAYDLASEHLGDDHPNLASAVNNLASFHQDAGDYTAAEPLFLRALDIRRRALGEEHPATALGFHNLGGLYSRWGRHEKAEEFFRRALELRLRILAPGHPEVMQSFDHLALLYDRTGDLRAAASIQREALEHARSTVGPRDPNLAFRLNNLGALSYRLEEYEEAERCLAAALEIERESFGRHHPDSAITLDNLAAVREAMGQHMAAERLYLEALEIRRRTVGERHPDFAANLTGLATLYDSMGDYAAAEPLYRQALEIRRDSLGERHPDFVESLNHLAGLYRSMGDYAASEAFCREVLQVARDVLGEEHRDYAASLNNLALLHFSMGDYAAALPLSRQALGILREVLGETDPDVATSLNNLAVLCGSMGDYAAAEPLYRRALDIQRAALGEEHPEYARSLMGLAWLHHHMGDYAAADPLYRRGLAIQRRALSESHPELAQSLNNAALLYASMRDYAAAESLYRQALDIRGRALGEEHPDYATSLDNLAVLYTSMGRHGAAEPLYRRALEIRRRTLGEEHPHSARNLNNVAVLYHLAGDYARAQPLYERALELTRRALGEEHPEVAEKLNNLAGLHHSQGNYTGAEPLYLEALAIRRRTLGDEHPDLEGPLNNLAALYVATGREGAAFKTFERTAAIEDRMLGQIFSVGSESQRMAYLEGVRRSFAMYLSLVCGSALAAATVNEALALLLRRKSMGAEALAAQREAVLGGRYPALEPKIRKLAALRMQIARKTLGGPGPEGLHVHERLLAGWEAQRAELESELARDIPEMNLEQELRKADRQAVARALPEGATLVEFVRFDVFDFEAVPARGEAVWKAPHYVAFVLGAGEPDTVELIDLGEAEPIDRLIAEFRTAVTGESEERGATGRGGAPQPDSESVADAGPSLRAAVFDPLARAIGDRRRLFLAPDGDLMRLPFEALPTHEGRPLLADYEISYVATGRDVLRFRKASTRKPGEPVVAADPDFDLGEGAGAPEGQEELPAAPGRRSRALDRSELHFDRLAGTRNEGESIATRLGVRPWLEGAAVESRLKACRSPHILHVATHGFFLPDQERDPETDLRPAPQTVEETGAPGPDRPAASRIENPLLRSGLALAGVNTWARGGALPEEAEDGLLTAEDVTGLDLLDTELVVLSACETGLGEVHVGEGVFGLRRAFVVAGAKGLVMSLWKVPDGPTQELMEEFYGRLLAGEGRADALRSAQLALRERYPHPYYWGAFIYQGDPGPIATGAGPA